MANWRETVYLDHIHFYYYFQSSSVNCYYFMESLRMNYSSFFLDVLFLIVQVDNLVEKASLFFHLPSIFDRILVWVWVRQLQSICALIYKPYLSCCLLLIIVLLSRVEFHFCRLLLRISQRLSLYLFQRLFLVFFSIW